MRERILFASLLLIGCSSGGGGLDPAGYVTQLGAADCQWYAKCGNLGVSEEKKCEALVTTTQKSYPRAYDLAAAVKAKRLKFDPKLAQTCVGLDVSSGCSVDAAYDYFDQCGNVFVGLVPVGGTCMAAFECAAGGWCDAGQSTGQSGCAGTCKANIATGQTCDPNAPHCGPADYCDSVSMQCTTALALGAQCAGEGCQSKLFCQGYQPGDNTTMPPTPEVKGTCKARGQVGADCNYVDFFGGTDCAVGLFCDDSQTTFVCATPGLAGSDCASGSGCKDGLVCAGLTYDQNSGAVATKGKCSAFGDVGSTCDSTADYTVCPFDTTCDATANTCKNSVLALGAACDVTGAGAPCDSNLYCDGPSAKCAAMLALGSACVPPVVDTMGSQTGSDPCHDGSCDTMTKTCSLTCTM